MILLKIFEIFIMKTENIFLNILTKMKKDGKCIPKLMEKFSKDIIDTEIKKIIFGKIS